MPTPTRIEEFPAGTVRLALAKGGPTGLRHVWIVDRRIAFANNTENAKLFAALPPGQQNRPFVVASLLAAQVNHNPATNSVTFVTLPPGTFVQGRDAWDQAETLYAARAASDSGTATVKQGFAGLKQIGKHE